MRLPTIRVTTIFLTAALLAPAIISRAQAKPSGLPPALREQMDAASAKFTSAQADLKQEIFTRIVHDTQTQAGQIYFLRKAGSMQMGMKLLPPDAAPGTAPAQVVEFNASKLRLFNPSTNQVDEFSATGKNHALAETMMTVGFGASGADLAKSWTITDLGPESIGGVKTEKLDLVSNDASIRNNFSHITIWIDPTRGVSLKQVSYQASNGMPTGDTRTVYYTNIRLNQPVSTAAFAINCKGKCTVVPH